jgi:hypothetical protein
MSKAFKGASQAANTLVQVAQRARNAPVAQQAQIVARMVQGLVRLERSFEAEGQQLSSALVRLQKSIRTGSVGRIPISGQTDGYYVRMVGTPARRRRSRAADTGLVGRRIGRGPVRMGSASGGAQSAKALSAAFARLLSAQTQLQQLQSDIERIKSRQ